MMADGSGGPIRHLDADDAPTLDATGLVVAPDFIDIHMRSEFAQLVDGSADSQRLTSMPAVGLGLSRRGRIAEGCCADVVILDEGSLLDRSALAAPNLPPSGVRHGIVAVRTVARAGRVLDRL